MRNQQESGLKVHYGVKMERIDAVLIAGVSELQDQSIRQ